MRLTMKERQTVTKAMANQYRRAPKKRKGAILDQLVEATGYNRVYAAQLLRGHGKRVEAAKGVVLEGSVRAKSNARSREPTYGPETVKALKKVWKIMDYICGKRLAPIVDDTVAAGRVVHRACQTGKRPLGSPDEQPFYWVDIAAARLSGYAFGGDYTNTDGTTAGCHRHGTGGPRPTAPTPSPASSRTFATSASLGRGLALCHCGATARPRGQQP